MKFFVECSVEISAEIFVSHLESPESHLGRLPVPGAGNVSLHCCHLPESKPQQCASRKQEGQNHEKERTSGKERTGLLESRSLRGDEADVVSKALDIPSLDTGRSAGNHRGRLGNLASGDFDCDRLGGDGDIFPRIHVIVGIFHRPYRKLSRAPRDERIFEGLASGNGAVALVRADCGLGVIHLEIRREIHLRFLQKGDIASTRDGDDQRGCIVGVDFIGSQPGRNAEAADTSSERSRLTGRQLIDLDADRRRLDLFPYGPVLILEETVEDAVGNAVPHPDIDQTDKFGRFYCHRAGLLRYESVSPEHCRVVDLVIKALTLEFDIGRRICFLAPEAIERRESGILEAGNIHSLVQLESGRDRLAYHNLAAVYGEFKEYVVVRNRSGG